MKQVCLVVTDLDGTFLNSKKEITPANRKAVKRLKDHGILFGIISGRPVESGVILNQSDWNLGKDLSVLGGMNGATILDLRTGEKDGMGMIDGYKVLEVISHYRDIPGLHFEVMIGNVQYVEWVTEETQAIAKLFGEEEKIVNYDEFLKERRVNKLIIRSKPEQQPEIIERSKTFHVEGLKCFPTSDVLFEYVHPDVNKGIGLQQICEHYGISLENVVAFGDQANDIEMLSLAGTGVAVKNATPAVKAISDVVLEYTNDEDAIAHYINEVILKDVDYQLEGDYE